MTPMEVIENFLDQVKEGKHDCLVELDERKQVLENEVFREWLKEFSHDLSLVSDAVNRLLYPDFKSRLDDFFSQSFFVECEKNGVKTVNDLKEFAQGWIDAGKEKLEKFTRCKKAEMTAEDAKKIAAMVNLLTAEGLSEDLAAKIAYFAFRDNKL